MVTKDELKKLDKPDTVLAATDPKTGAKGFRVGVEVFHQVGTCYHRSLLFALAQL